MVIITGCSARWNPRTDARRHEQVFGLISYHHDGKKLCPGHLQGRDSLNEHSGT